MVACYRRAAVLAERGQLWILLQNVARSMSNAISSLLLAVARFRRRDVREASRAAVYGLACKTLYVVADGLVELFSECGVMNSPPPPPPRAASLSFSPGLDDANEMGVAVVKQVVFMSLHTLYIHQHYEKLLALGLCFDDVTK